MAFRIKGSHIAALVIAGVVIGWMANGDIVIGGQEDSANSVPPPAERQADDQELFKVRYAVVNPEQRPEVLVLRGRTTSKSVVAVRAQTKGTLEKRHVEKGDRVKVGDLLCEIDPGVRDTVVLRTQAALDQAIFDYQGAQSLHEQGYSTDARLKALKSAVDTAKAALAEARHELSHTDVTATADGVIADPIAEIGSHLNAGDVCVTIIDSDPMLFVGQVSERQVGNVDVGYEAEVSLITGQTANGTISYISPAADPATRTFLTEIELPNGDGSLRDGITASATIELNGGEAYRIVPSWLTLEDAGALGVRVVDDNDRVAFVPLKIVAHTPESMWVTGLTPGTRVITLGQDYVKSGQIVQPVPSELATNGATDEVRS